jgi:hypothetical protein
LAVDTPCVRQEHCRAADEIESQVVHRPADVNEGTTESRSRDARDGVGLADDFAGVIDAFGAAAVVGACDRDEIGPVAAVVDEAVNVVIV